ncbi:MAG: hypothetical protein JWP87_214 [Labilithrix sp.]|nr:hypothetical protein [Labilithrix sp.]
MAAAVARPDDRPTEPYPVPSVPVRRVPPPLPPASQRPRTVVPRALGKAKLVIELPLDALDDQELAEITAWLRGRASPVVVRPTPLSLAAHQAGERIVTFARALRERVLDLVQSALVWTLSRVRRAEGRRLRESLTTHLELEDLEP